MREVNNICNNFVTNSKVFKINVDIDIVRWGIHYDRTEISILHGQF